MPQTPETTDHGPTTCEFCRRKALCGARLRKLRLERGLSQWDLADLLGVSDVMVSFWERGAHLPSLTDAFYLAHILNRQVVDLFQPIHDYAGQEVRHDQSLRDLDLP